MRAELVTKIPWVLVVMLSGTSTQSATQTLAPFPLANEDRVSRSSLELERRTMPWCPHDCAVVVPFVATYRKGTEQLVFVAAHHDFRPDTPTMRAVDEGFAEIRPNIVIVEAFPTAMGESPPPLVREAQRHGSANADEFARGEDMYAASLALSRGIPFIGGEPTQEEQAQVLKAKGFTDAELAFNSLMGWLSQALRSGDISNTSAASLTKIYPRLVLDVRAQTHLQAPSLQDFRQRYRQLYGVDIVGDAKFPLRTDVGDTSRHGQMATIDMMTRDRHLLGLIEQQLTDRHSVLVVYGGSHWATLSLALEKRLGKPTVRPYLK